VHYLLDRRKISTKYHEPLRRISSHHGELSSYDKKTPKKHHKKKHKKDHIREAKLQKLINQNNEEEKAKSREKPADRHDGAVALPEELKDKLKTDINGKSIDLSDNKKESVKVPTEIENEKIPSLASREDDSIEVGDIPADSNDGFQIQVENEQELEHSNEKTALVTSVTKVGEEGILSKSENCDVDEPIVIDEDIGIQMREIVKKEEVMNAKQIRKFVPKDRDSALIDIMPKIKEYDELSFDHTKTTVSEDYTDRVDDHEKQIATKTEQDIESHHRDKLVALHHLENQSHKRHHHRHHRKREVKQHRTISEREALADKVRLRSGLLTLQETEPSVDDFAKIQTAEDDEESNLEKKDLEEIACKISFYSNYNRHIFLIKNIIDNNLHNFE
jgi:hypothetical protein